MDTAGGVSSILYKGDNCCSPGQQIPSEKGSTLKGKNLLQKEQILSFQRRPLFRKGGKTCLKELPFLQVYQFLSD